MAKCELDIRKDIVSEVGKRLSNLGAIVEEEYGYFPDPAVSKKAIDFVNDAFKTAVINQGDEGSFTINPPKALINRYLDAYNKKPLIKAVGSEGNLQYQLKVVNNISNNIDRIEQLFKQLKDTDTFWNKIQKDFQIPKEQLGLLREEDGDTIDEKLASFTANYSYTIEINVAKEATFKQRPSGFREESEDKVQAYTDSQGQTKWQVINTEIGIIESGFDTKESALAFIGADINGKKPTSYYSNLAVPGGTNYTENEIATPAIAPAITGHAQFSTQNGIGWFRSDDKAPIVEGFTENKEAPEEWGMEDAVLKEESKTRRILELQSDLFQKGRDEGVLVDVTASKDLDKLEQNRFLQLLNKDNNWVTFFVKSIIQDSAKKGYEKVLFPKGDTASKIEGQQTLDEYIKVKEDRLKELEDKLKTNATYYGVASGENGEIQKQFDTEQEALNFADSLNSKLDEYTPRYFVSTEKKYGGESKESINNEIAQIKQELKDVENGDMAKLKAIHFFYETTIANILKKQGYSPKTITDEPGNQWYEVEIKEKDKEVVLFNVKGEATVAMGNVPTSVREATMEILKKMGIKVESLVEYAKKVGLRTTGINGVADMVRGLIAMAEGAEDVVLVEEMVHFATAIIEAQDPNTITALISNVSKFPIYKKLFNEYKQLKQYQLPDGKPNVRLIKKEVMDRLITQLIINGSTENFGELESEIQENVNIVTKMWNTIMTAIRNFFRRADIAKYQAVAARIINGEVAGTFEDIKNKDVLFNATPVQKSVVDKLDETNRIIYKEYGEETEANPLLGDSEEANNWYMRLLPDGSAKRVLKRVTDKVKAWYKQRFPNKEFTPEEIAFNEVKRKYGIAGHADFEGIVNRYYNKDGTRKTNPDPAPAEQDTNLKSLKFYGMLENYLLDVIKTLPEGTLVFAERIIYNDKIDEGGTLDVFAIEPDGTGNVLDWKFMQISKKNTDVPFFKQGAYGIQLDNYKETLSKRYGVKKFRYFRAVPILMELRNSVPNDPESEVILTGISIGSVNPSSVQDLRLVPVSQREETTGYEVIDRLIKRLNAMLAKVSKEQGTTLEEKEFKIERLNLLRRAIRELQGNLNFVPLIETIQKLSEEGKNIINEYELVYKNLSANDNKLTEQQLSDFADQMRLYIATAEAFQNIDFEIGKLIFTEEYLADAKTEEERKDALRRKEILDGIKKQAEDIKESREKVFRTSRDFADKFMGQRNLVGGLLKPEAILRGLASAFRGASQLGNAAIELMHKIITNSKADASRSALERVQKLIDIRNRIAEKHGNVKQYVAKVFQRGEKDEFVNKLIYQYSKDFYTQVDKLADEEDPEAAMDWLKENIDMEAYRVAAAKKIEEDKVRIDNSPAPGATQEEKDKYRKEKKTESERKYNIDREDFNGWNNYIIKQNPLKKWYTKEYAELLKPGNEEALEFYNYIRELNKFSNEVGYIDAVIEKTFLPFVRKSAAEKLLLNGNLFGPIENFFTNLQAKADDIGYGSFNEMTKTFENALPRYYTYDFTRTEDNKNDYSDVSEEVFQNLILYIQQVEKYKYLKQVEGQIKLVRDIEQFKGHIVTNKIGDVTESTVVEENAENLRYFDALMRAMLYGQKYTLSDSDTPLYIDKALNFAKGLFNKVAGKEVFKKSDETTYSSLTKAMEAANKGVQLKALGFEFISGVANLFGSNLQMSAQAGKYFKSREFFANEAKLSKMLIGIEDDPTFVEAIHAFMPLAEDPNYDLYKEAGLTTLTRASLTDALMVFMRKPEQLVEKSIFHTLLDNMMIEDGKIVSIPAFVKKKYKDRYTNSTVASQSREQINAEIEELKKTRAISKTMILDKDGKLEIPGFDMSNKKEIQRLTNLARKISRDVTGTMSNDDLNRMSLNIWTKSMMVFKNWIPKLTDTRFGEFRRINEEFGLELDEDGAIVGESYDVGRIRLLLFVAGRSIQNRTSNILNILQLNEKGLQELDNLYEIYAAEYEKRTGNVMSMSREDFKDMIYNNLYNEVKELLIFMSLLSAAFALGFFAPDDDEDKATKNAFRYYQKILDKGIDEIGFFYNPFNYAKLLQGGLFPAVSIFTDITKFINHMIMEMTGFDLSNPTESAEDVRKKAMPIKYLAKSAPITRNVIIYLSMISPEFAKEYKITVQKESSRR